MERMKRQIQNMSMKAYLTLLLIGSILLMTHSPTQCASINQTELFAEYQMLINPSISLVVVNPGAKKQLLDETKFTKKQERKAFRKYVKSLKKDLKKNKKGGEWNYQEVKKKTDAVAIIMLILFGLLFVGIIFLIRVFSEGIV
jgi:hypothetical protein